MVLGISAHIQGLRVPFSQATAIPVSPQQLAAAVSGQQPLTVGCLFGPLAAQHGLSSATLTSMSSTTSASGGASQTATESAAAATTLLLQNPSPIANHQQSCLAMANTNILSQKSHTGMGQLVSAHFAYSYSALYFNLTNNYL